MNLLAHIIVSFITVRHFTGNPYLILLGILFGVLPDFDHVTHLKKAVKTGRFGPESRSRFHELYGLSIFSLIVVAISVLDNSLFPVTFFPLLSHYLMDFFTRPTRQLNPATKKVLHLGFYPKPYKRLVLADLIVTGVLILVWIL